MTKHGGNTPRTWSSLRCEKLVARPGRRDELVAALRTGAEQLRAAGCDLHVRVSQDDPDVVWMTQVWTASEGKRVSPGVPAVKRALAEALSLLTASGYDAGEDVANA